MPTEGLDQLPQKGGAWIIPGFTLEVKEQRAMSEKMKILLNIFKNDIHGSADDVNNTVFNVIFNRVETSANMQTVFYKMSQLAIEQN